MVKWLRRGSYTDTFLSFYPRQQRNGEHLKCIQTSLGYIFLLFFKYLSPTFCFVPKPACKLSLAVFFFTSAIVLLSILMYFLLFLLSRLSLDTWHYFLSFNEVCSPFIWFLPTSLSLLSSTRATFNEENLISFQMTHLQLYKVWFPITYTYTAFRLV